MNRYAASLVVVSAVACSSSGAPQRKLDDSALVQDLTRSLQGQPTKSTQNATQLLIAALDAEEWGYLLGAQWPAGDVNAVLEDPVVRKAMAVVGAHAQAPTTKSVRILSLDESASDVSGSFDRPIMQKWYDDARVALTNANGTASTGSAPGTTSFVNGFVSVAQQTQGTPLPSAGGPADPATWTCAEAFFKGGGSTSATCDNTNFCCRGTLDYTGGNGGGLTCFDSTSCKGAGAPPKLSPGGPAGGPDAGPSVDDPCGLIGTWTESFPALSCDTCTRAASSDTVTITAAQVKSGVVIPSSGSCFQIDAKTCAVTANPQAAGNCPGPAYGCNAQGSSTFTGTIKNGSGSMTTDGYCPHSASQTCTICKGAIRSSWTKNQCIAT